MIYQFVRKRGLQDADAADLTQIVLEAVGDGVKRLDYDPQRGFVPGAGFSEWSETSSAKFRVAMEEDRSEAPLENTGSFTRTSGPNCRKRQNRSRALGPGIPAATVPLGGRAGESPLRARELANLLADRRRRARHRRCRPVAGFDHRCRVYRQEPDSRPYSQGNSAGAGRRAVHTEVTPR